MCLIALAWKYRPDYPLVVAANRDEFTDRPTAPAGFWPDAPELLAGRDLVGGGTWLGITRGGRFAAVTNYRDPSARLHGAPSRGALVRDFLLDGGSPETFLKRLVETAGEYEGFNLLAGDRDALFYFGNRDGTLRPLPPGVYALSNGLLGDQWPKTTRAGKSLRMALDYPAPPDPEALFALLADSHRPPDGELPETGVGLEWERVLSSAFISTDGYGTRASAVVLLDSRGGVDLRERTFAGGEEPPVERRFSFSLSP